MDSATLQVFIIIFIGHISKSSDLQREFTQYSTTIFLSILAKSQTSHRNSSFSRQVLKSISCKLVEREEQELRKPIVQSELNN